jgi:hypothetical protein
MTVSAIAVDGGYQISDRWLFAFGSMHSNWFMVSALVEDDKYNIVGMRVVALTKFSSGAITMLPIYVAIIASTINNHEKYPCTFNGFEIFFNPN